MQAIEFQAKVKDGNITIPEQYKDSIKGNVRVILLAEDSTENVDMIEYLLAHPLNVQDFKPLMREEIYERR
jgi:hypothetical protein